MRKFHPEDFYQTSPGDPLRSVVCQSPHTTIVAWILKPGQEIRPHVHPLGQDTWHVVAGSGHYVTNTAGHRLAITAGEVVVAHQGEVHGVINTGPDDLKILSVVSPGEAGYALIEIAAP